MCGKRRKPPRTPQIAKYRIRSVTYKLYNHPVCCIGRVMICAQLKLCYDRTIRRQNDRALLLEIAAPGYWRRLAGGISVIGIRVRNRAAGADAASRLCLDLVVYSPFATIVG